tara:strand:- start:1070 stop:2062 length:993 start_codon:yes stop_codon:yes gene_type:complete
MTTSVHKLYDYFEGQDEIHPAIIMDLFGYANWTSFMKSNRDHILTLFWGLYKGLYRMGVTQKEIYRCFLQNKLDDLIHIKYSVTSSCYYDVFCGKSVTHPNDFESNDFEDFEKQMVGKPVQIGNTFMYAQDESVTQKQIIPLIYTIMPSFVRIKNVLTDIDDIISKKIKAYKEQDTRKVDRNPIFAITDKYVTIDDVKKLIRKQEEKCYVCGDVVSISSRIPNILKEPHDMNELELLSCINNLMDSKIHTSGCMYQFTLDRIDNKLPHNGDNILICCQYCNCFGETDKHTEVDHRVCKVCPNKCHTLKRNDIKRTRREVSREEIEQLILN